MSVTFYPDTTSFPAVWGITCYDPELAEPTFIGNAENYEQALEVRAVHMASCEECRAYGCYTSSRTVGIEVPDVNVSNTNAGSVLDALGIEVGDLCGSMGAEEFLGRVLVALATEPVDAGIAPVSYRVKSGRTVESSGDVAAEGEGCTWHDMGRRPGYMQDRLELLREIAEFAREHNVSVQWA